MLIICLPLKFTHTYNFSGQVIVKFPLKRHTQWKTTFNYWIILSNLWKPGKELNFLVQTYFWSHALNFGWNGIDAVLSTNLKCRLGDSVE